MLFIYTMSCLFHGLKFFIIFLIKHVIFRSILEELPHVVLHD